MNIVDYCDELEMNKKFVISRQLLRSGTSIGANVREGKMPKARMILSTNSKSLLKKRMKLNTGWIFAKQLRTTHNAGACMQNSFQSKK